MAKNKYDFIQDLLTNKRLTPPQKERVLFLAKQEIKKDSTGNDEIRKRILKIERKLENVSNTNLVDFPKEQIKSEFTKQLKNNPDLPKKYIDSFSKNGLRNFLIAFNQDPVLKYTAHLIDNVEYIDNLNSICNVEKYALEHHRNLIKETFENLVNQYYLDSNISTMFRVYLTGVNYEGKKLNWSSANVKINWFSPELLDWSVKNDGIVPNPTSNLVKLYKNKGFKLPSPFKSALSGKPVQYFSDLILYFKSLYVIKGSNSLRNIIEYVNEVEFKELDIAFNHFADDIVLYTDVDKLIQGYKKLVRLNIVVTEERKFDFPKIELQFIKDEKFIDFIIYHKNAKYYGKPKEEAVNVIGEAYTDLIKHQLNGVCDFYISAYFQDDGCYLINLWNNKEIEAQPIEEQFQGVKHIFRFKR